MPRYAGGEEAAWEAALGLSWLSPCGYHGILRRLAAEGPEAVWRASRAQLKSWGLRPRGVNGFQDRRAAFSAADARAALATAGLRFIPYGHADFPEELSQLTVPPAGLFVRGTQAVWRELLCVPRIAIVGTRRTTGTGVRATEAFAAAFAAAGVAVVSGMAFGVDTRAHKAAVEVGGLTAAVLGCGADIVYPAANRWLYDKIATAGVVISELPPGCPPAPWTFPHRNRLLAALGDAVLVVEAPITSGALQTADAALELGRPVFSVPGCIYSDGYAGCNKLIYDGAGAALQPSVTVEDFLAQTRIERGSRQVLRANSTASSGRAERGGSGCPSRNDQVWLALGMGPASIDLLVARTGLSARDLSAALAELELEGLARRLGPGMYARGP